MKEASKLVKAGKGEINIIQASNKELETFVAIHGDLPEPAQVEG